MKKKFILFDIDNTLYDTSSLRHKLFAKVFHVLQENDITDSNELAEEIYHDLVKKTGIFYPDDLVRGLTKALPDKKIPEKELLDAMYDITLLEPHLYEEAHDLVREFEKIGELGIFSQGMERFQRLKVKRIAHFFAQHHTHIVTSKLSALDDVFQKYHQYDVFFLDDALPVLAAAKKAYPKTYTIWVKRGRHALAQKPIKGFTPDDTVKNLRQAEKIIREN